MDIESLKANMIDACQRLERRALVANHDGNISVRISESEFVATPTAKSKGSLCAEDLIIVNFAGEVLSGTGKIFSEWSWHAAIYLERADVTSVCHAHPPYGTASALTGDAVDFSSIPESIVTLGAPIQTLDWNFSAKASTESLRPIVRGALETSYAFFVPGNGAFTVGDDAEMASLRMEVLEHISKIHAIARQQGTVKRLPSDYVNDLHARRPPLKPQWSGGMIELSSPQPVAPADSSIAPAQNIDELLLLEKIKQMIATELRNL